MSSMLRQVPGSFYMLLGRHLEKYQVSWTPCVKKDGIGITTFYRFGDEKGNGALALQEVCDLADDYGAPLYLFTDYRKLVSYYERFGFVITDAYHDHWEFRRQNKPTNGVPAWWREVWRNDHQGFFSAVNRESGNVPISQVLSF